MMIVLMIRDDDHEDDRDDDHENDRDDDGWWIAIFQTNKKSVDHVAQLLLK